jgi:opacity protein-like surface antigen
MRQTPVFALAAVFMCLASNASAQDNGFVRGLFGVTFDTEDNAPMFGGSAGLNLGSLLQITGEVGRMQDVKPQKVRDQVDELAALLSLSLRTPVTLDVDAPVFYAIGGVRVLPTGSSIRLFVEVNAGLARMTFDVPDATVAGISIAGVVRETLGDESRNKFLLVAGGGIAADLSARVTAEAGYRYQRIFTDDPAVNLSNVYGAIAFKF